MIEQLINSTLYGFTFLFIFLFIFFLMCVYYYKLKTSLKVPQIVRYKEEETFVCSDGTKKEFPYNTKDSTAYLSVIVPSYNEEERLPIMMDETLNYLENKFKETYEVIVVDDGSKDKTSEVAIKYVKKYGDDKVRVLTLKKNRGKGGAVRLGMLSSRGELLLMADADGATKFSDISKLISKFQDSQQLQVVVGSRAHLEDDAIAERSFFRTILMKGFHMIVWLFCVRTVRDTQCGFKVFTREASQVIFNNLHVERWAFDVEVLLIAEKLGIKVDEVAVNWQEIDGSKVTPVFTWIEMGKDILFIWLNHFLGFWSIKQHKID